MRRAMRRIGHDNEAQASKKGGLGTVPQLLVAPSDRRGPQCRAIYLGERQEMGTVQEVRCRGGQYCNSAEGKVQGWAIL